MATIVFTSVSSVRATTSVEPCVGTSSPSSLQALCWVALWPASVCSHCSRQLPRRFLWPVCEFLSRADVSGQEACPHSPDAWNRRPTGRWWLHRFSVWIGRCRGWLCQRALHDMVQRTHPQCGCHQCCPWFSHRAGQRGGLCDQRPVGLPLCLQVLWATCGYLLWASLPPAACSLPLWGQRQRITFRSKAQTGVCQPALRQRPPTCSGRAPSRPDASSAGRALTALVGSLRCAAIPGAAPSELVNPESAAAPAQG